VSACSAVTSFDFPAASWAVDEELAQVCAPTQPSPFSEIHPPEGRAATPQTPHQAPQPPCHWGHADERAAAAAAVAAAAAGAGAAAAPSPFYQHQAEQQAAAAARGGPGGAAPQPAVGLLPWYRSAVAGLESLLARADAHGGGADASAPELEAAVNALLGRVFGLAASDRAAAAALLCTNLETEGAAAPSEAHWRAAAAHLGLSPAQRAAALDVFALFKERAAARAADKAAALAELQALASGAALASAYPAAAARLERLLAAEAGALAALASALRRLLVPRQLARWAVHAWPFVPSPLDTLAALEQEHAAAAVLPPSRAASLLAAGLRL
jgi:hypothetical protein